MLIQHQDPQWLPPPRRPMDSGDQIAPTSPQASGRVTMASISRLTIVSREAKKKQPYATNEFKTHDSESRGQEEAAVRDE